MSTFTIIDAARVMRTLLAECWDQNKRCARREQEAQEEYDRRLEQIDRECERKNREAARARDEALARLEKERGLALEEDVRRTRLFEGKLAEIRNRCRSVADASSRVGNAFLANAANYHDEAGMCERVAAAKEEIRREARAVMDRAGVLTPEDAREALRDMERACDALGERFRQLVSLLERNEATAGEIAERRERYLSLLSDLSEGTKEALRSVSALPPDPDAAGAAESLAALKTVEYYLYGAGGFYLPATKKEELRRLYGVHGDLEGDLRTVEQMDAETLRRLNMQFRSSKKRAFDQEISRRRERIGELWETYANMYEKLRGSLDGALEPRPDADDMLEILERETEAMRPKYLERVRQDMLQEMVERCLLKSRSGRRVRRVAEDAGASGNRRTLYEIGESGACVEIYTDARGQILIETGAIIEGDERTERQTETISRNNRYFCDHELPALLDALRDEMEAAGTEFEVRLRREPEEDRVHTFDLGSYAASDGEAGVIAADGTLVRRDGGVAAQKRKALDEDGGVIDA